MVSNLEARFRVARGWVKDAALHLPARLQPSRLRARQQWAIGFYEGPGPLALHPRDSGPVLTRRDVHDVAADFVADPFLVRWCGRWLLFFEVMNRVTRRGEIGLATSTDLRSWQYEGVILREPFHLSYPVVVPWGDDFYLLPETSGVQVVRLYRATRFPTEWAHDADLLVGLPFRDATPFRHGERWWMFADTGAHWTEGTLRLYGSDALHGPWSEHPASPIVSRDPGRARPAGRVVRLDDGSLVRFAQDCRERYGERVYAFRIDELDADRYREKALPGPVLDASGQGWNARGMHHLDAHRCGEGRWVACVDGN